MKSRLLRVPVTVAVSFLSLATSSCGQSVAPDAATDAGSDVVDAEPASCSQACGALFSVVSGECSAGIGSDGGAICIPLDDSGAASECAIATPAFATTGPCCCEAVV